MAKPLGGPKYELSEPTHLLGAFVSRTNWGLALFGGILTIGGVAGAMAAIYDVYTGRATVGEVVKDIGIFIEGWIAELIAPGLRRRTREDPRLCAVSAAHTRPAAGLVQPHSILQAGQRIPGPSRRIGIRAQR
jgi:hypothetical protein